MDCLDIHVQSVQNNMQRRIERALGQRIYLIEAQSPLKFHVSGLTSSYYIELNTDGLHHTCTCPDYMRRRLHCKHIFWILFRHLHVDVDEWMLDHLLLPKELTNEEYTGPRGRILHEEDTECCVCFEEYTEESDLIHCMECGHSFHSECYKVWMMHSKRTYCPFCRSDTGIEKRKQTVNKNEWCNWDYTGRHNQEWTTMWAVLFGNWLCRHIRAVVPFSRNKVFRWYHCTNIRSIVVILDV